MRRKSVQKRMVRVALLVSNALFLIIIFAFVRQSSYTKSDVHTSSTGLTTAAVPLNPVDQLSSANIALTVARMSQLPETTLINNQADSEETQLALAPTNDNVVAKPQVLTTALKSKADIKNYKTVAGDTIGSIASKFGVTSNSIRWSNGLSGDSIASGKTIVIPPVNGIVYTVKSGDTIDSLAQKYNANKDQLIAYNDAETAGIKLGEQIIIPDGTVVTPVNLFVGLGWGSASFGSNGYAPGWCTWYVANKRIAIGKPVPTNLGNASTWAWNARRFGIAVGSTPQAGAVGVLRGGDHVIFIEQVNADGSFWISEMNGGSGAQKSITDPTPAGGWLYQIGFRHLPASSVSKYDYIY